MNSATAMLVKEILENGWYRKGTTLGGAETKSLRCGNIMSFRHGKSPDSIWHTIDAITAR